MAAGLARSVNPAPSVDLFRSEYGFTLLEIPGPEGSIVLSPFLKELQAMSNDPILPPATRPSLSSREPVSLSTAVQGVLVAVFALAKLFEWWHWSDAQEAGVLTLYLALVLLLGVVTRSKVRPDL